jgi:carbon storage regulator
MLVIARRESETTLAGDIEATVLSIRGNQVRLGIKAPGSVVVSRKELLNSGQPKKKVKRLSLTCDGRQT